MAHALAAASEALDRGDVPVGAALFIDGRFVGTGSNSVDSTCDDTQHAEMVVIRRFARMLFEGKRRRSVELFVTMEPCAMCFGAIAHFRIGRVVSAVADPAGGVVEHLRGFAYYGSRGTQWESGVRAGEAQALLDSYVDASGRRPHLHSSAARPQLSVPDPPDRG